MEVRDTRVLITGGAGFLGSHRLPVQSGNEFRLDARRASARRPQRENVHPRHSYRHRAEPRLRSLRVDVLRVAALPGRTFRARPRAVVLAAGGIENARLLLASRRDRPSGLGNEYDLVGFFMEHLHVPAGHMVAEPGVSRAFYLKARRDGVLLRGAIAPTAAARDRHRLPPTSIGIEPVSFSSSTPFCGWPPPVTFAPNSIARCAEAASPLLPTLKFNAERASRARLKWQTWNAARAALARAGRLQEMSPARSHRLYSLYFRAEQTPNPTSRVSLSERRDALGTPEVKLDWRVSKSDIDAIPAWLELFDAEVRARGLGRVIAPPERWDRGIIGGPHHMGTTRMSADPRARTQGANGALRANA
jgi:hypothetical protein